MIYFTPYNTLEIWGYNEFLDLKREWDSPEEGLYTNLREYIDPDSLPESNVTIEEFNTDTFALQYLSYPGLAYTIPMKGLNDPDSNEIMNGAKRFKTDGCKNGNTQRYKGTIKGNIKAWVNTNGNGSTDMDITGIYVELWDRDYGKNPDDFLGSGYTYSDLSDPDNLGLFSISVNVCQNFQGINQPEGGDLEVYVKIFARNDGERVRVRNRIGATIRGTSRRSNPFTWYYNNGNDNNQNMGAIHPGKDDTKLHLVHYAHQCLQFVNNNVPGLNLGGSGSKLEIMQLPFVNATFMLPGDVANAMKIDHNVMLYVLRDWVKFTGFSDLVLSNQDCIYRDFSDDEGENTPYHEFGHYLMWHLQHRWFNYQLPFRDHRLDINSFQEKLAWSEGWAEGFGQIMDIVTRDFDSEAGRDLGSRFDYESRIVDGDNPEIATNNVHRVNNFNSENTVTHGLLSEMNIASMMVDLFDGPENPNLINGVELHNDNGIWRSGRTDDLSLTFLQICHPLIDNPGPPTGPHNFPFITESVIQNVFEYGYVLINYLDCELKAETKEVFNENRISDFNPTNQGQIINSDAFSQYVTVNYPNYKIKKNKDTKRDELYFNENNDAEILVDVPTIGNNITFNYTGDLGTDAISDELTINSGTLSLNNTSLGMGFAPGSSVPSYSDIFIEVCNSVTVMNEGLIEVGDDGGTYNAWMLYKSGSSLSFVIPPGVTNPPGTLRINNNSKLVIEEGATLRIGPGTEIILDGPNAILEIRGTLILEDGASLAPVGGSNGLGFVRFNMPNIGNTETAANRIQFGNGSFIRFEGSSSSTKVMEVTDHFFWIVNSGSNNHFDVINGKIEMGEDAVLNLGVRCVFNHVKVEPMSGIGSFAGIYLWGHSYGLNDLTITGSSNGLNSFNNVGGLPLRINDLELQECGQGLLVDGRALILENPLIENGDNDYGIKVKGAHYPSKLTNPVISDVVVGTSYTGNSSSPLSMFSANYTVTGNAVEFDATSSLMSRCGTFTGDNTGYGFRVSSGANVVMANAFGQAGGGNVFFNAGAGKAFNQTIRIGGNPIYLNGGKNDLRFNSGGMALVGLTFWGVASNGDLAGGGNLWDNTSPYLPVSTQNYDLWYIPDPFPFFPPLFSRATITGVHETPSTYSRTAYCAGSTTGTGAGPGTALPTNPRTITYGAPFQNVKDVFEDILTRQYDSVQAVDIMPDWEIALTASEWNTTRTVTDYAYLNIGLAKMNELAGDYLVSDSAFLSNPDSTNGIFASVKNTINYWIARCDTASDLAAIQLLDYLKFQKAGLFCLVNDYSKAGVLYSDLASNADSNLIPLAEYWVCQIDRVQQILERGTDHMFLDSLPECTVAFPEEYPEPVAIKIPGNGKSITAVPLIRPNPVSSFLQLSLNGSEYDHIEITNSIGQRVYERTLSRQFNDWYIFDISELPEGLYTTTLYDSKQLNRFTQKIMIVR